MCKRVNAPGVVLWLVEWESQPQQILCMNRAFLACACSQRNLLILDPLPFSFFSEPYPSTCSTEQGLWLQAPNMPRAVSTVLHRGIPEKERYVWQTHISFYTRKAVALVCVLCFCSSSGCLASRLLARARIPRLAIPTLHSTLQASPSASQYRWMWNASARPSCLLHFTAVLTVGASKTRGLCSLPCSQQTRQRRSWWASCTRLSASKAVRRIL